jgi:hypothetical protein
MMVVFLFYSPKIVVLPYRPRFKHQLIFYDVTAKSFRIQFLHIILFSLECTESALELKFKLKIWHTNLPPPQVLPYHRIHASALLAWRIVMTCVHALHSMP